MIEMLYLQWGFYFNAAKSDFGSDDLSRLADFIDSHTLEDSANVNTRFAKNATLLLFLSRLMILSYCLKIPGCRQTFEATVNVGLGWVNAPTTNTSTKWAQPIKTATFSGNDSNGEEEGNGLGSLHSLGSVLLR
jgi:hypothetical protein